MSGNLTEQGGTYSLGGTPLDLSAVGLGATATADFDQDGTVETNAQELDGMLGKSVTVVAVLTNGKLVVSKIVGL